MKKEFQKIKKIIKTSKKILIVSHRDPDGDSLGSMLALKIALQNFGKEVVAISSEPIPIQFNFLPNVWQLKQKEDNSSFDLIFCLDYGSPERIDLPLTFPEGKVRGLPHPPNKIITIDHHLSENQIGQIKLIEPQASSTCEILYGLFENFGWSITKGMAVCLLTGIITDTASFRNPTTSPHTLTVAGQLLSQVGSLSKIIKYASNYDFETIRLWGQILNKIEVDKKIGLIVAALSYQDSQKINVREQDLAGFANFLNLIKEAKVSLILLEKQPRKIKGSLRSKSLDVASLAEKLGGGGHRLAAGFETEGKIEKVVQVVKKELIPHLRSSKGAGLTKGQK